MIESFHKIELLFYFMLIISAITLISGMILYLCTTFVSYGAYLLIAGVLLFVLSFILNGILVTFHHS